MAALSTRRRRRGREVHGVLLFDKPLGLSSNQALQRVKRLFDANKAGHTGSLDVLASGLLPVCFGEATKVCQFLLDADKRYLAEITFGKRTSSGDAEGEVISERPLGDLDAAGIAAAAETFLGVIDQVPPMHSALKRDGQRLYKLAHQGLKVEREPRQVRIDRFDVLDFDSPRAVVDIACSKGTYIRTLAEDLGERLACGGYVSALQRTAAGPYHNASALTLIELEELSAQGGMEALDALLLPTDSALEHLPRAELSGAAVRDLKQGQSVVISPAPVDGLLRLYDNGQRFFGVGEMQADGRMAPRRLFHLQVSESQENSPRLRT